MTELRKKMIEDMVLRGFSENTRMAYVHAVKMLARYYNTSPEKLSQKNIRDFFLHLVSKKKAARSTFMIYLSGIKFFFERTLSRKWEFFQLAKPKRRIKLPEVLSEEEVRKILSCIKNPILRMCSTLIYSCGLRVSEACNLKASDIDSRRMVVKIQNGKGGKDRLAPLPERTLTRLREYYHMQKPRGCLFPANDGKKPVSRITLHKMLKKAAKDSGIKKNVYPHTLRHSYATHLLENGISLQTIQNILGHTHLSTTYMYVHLTSKSIQDTVLTINKIMKDL